MGHGIDDIYDKKEDEISKDRKDTSKVVDKKNSVVPPIDDEDDNDYGTEDDSESDYVKSDHYVYVVFESEDQTMDTAWDNRF